MKQIADISYRRRWLVLAGWIGLVASLLGAYLLFAGEYKTEFELPGLGEPGRRRPARGARRRRAHRLLRPGRLPGRTGRRTTRKSARRWSVLRPRSRTTSRASKS